MCRVFVGWAGVRVVRQSGVRLLPEVRRDEHTVRSDQTYGTAAHK